MSSAPRPDSPPLSSRLEVPTLILWAVIHGGWIMLTLASAKIPTPLLAALGGWILAWHGSFQHEAIHGHPTPWRRVNDALASAPLSLWLPYPLYRRTHLAHHATHDLTSPEHDPESRYLPPSASRWARVSAFAGSTLAGRLLLGPPIEIATFLVREARSLASPRAAAARRIWATHLALVAVVLAWLHFACGLSLGRYLLCFVYPGAALSLIRSFAEHRAHRLHDRRVAVVENAPVLGLLFLNNNLHAAHHDSPGTPWYRLPGRYVRERARLLSSNGGLVYDGYGEIFRRYLLTPHDHADHGKALETSS
ncbi:fatty acid desaturase [Caulobacter sp. CCNWLY153]|uniref:fatty acid desaturase n=1 Tax=unclassified Caulobacter TaxID=2648921 RepID=UPI002FEEA07B